MVAVNPLDLGATVKTPLWKLLGWASEAAWVSAGSPSAPPPVPSGVTAAGPKTEDPAALLGYNNAPALGKSLSAVVKSLVTPQNTLQAPPPPPPVPAQPTFSSTATAAPASTAVAPAVAPESQPARLVAPSQGAGTQFTQGMTTLPKPVSLPTLPAPSGAPTGSFNQLAPGNIDLNARPIAHNPDGSISTVRSITIEQDGKQILIPTVSPDGRVLSNDEAIRLYQQTGQNLGTFATNADAEAYANALHQSQAARYTPSINTGLANAAGAGLVAGTNQPYVPPPSLLQRS